WLPDQVYYETRGLSPDTVTILNSMGYQMKEQTPWGATELIMIGLPGAAGVAGAASSGNDSAVSGKVRPGFYYGANDARRPAGAAVGY
ncbi:MAG: gamma-glutamyltransferase, partial [Burkholderiales bacterium]